MHTATRLAVPVIDRVRAAESARRGCAPTGCTRRSMRRCCASSASRHVLGGEFEDDLVRTAAPAPQPRTASAGGAADGDRPCRASASGSRSPRSAGALALRARCRSAANGGSSATPRPAAAASIAAGTVPIVPVYDGRFRIVPCRRRARGRARAGRGRGAAHHVRRSGFLQRPAPRARAGHGACAREFPGADLRRHDQDRASARARRAAAACCATPAACSSPARSSRSTTTCWRSSRKGTRAPTSNGSSRCCRDAGLTLVPTFVAFTPWTTLAGYCELLQRDRRARSGRARAAGAAGDPAARSPRGRACWSSTTSAR